MLYVLQSEYLKRKINLEEVDILIEYIDRFDFQFLTIRPIEER